MASDATSAFLAAAEQTFISNFAMYSGLTIVFYDCLISIEDEVEFFWSRKLSKMTLVYAGLRYGGIVWSM
ncbi:hypothetical protein CONPUDRAFT_158461 [Coniophora puteana RWD-64-598 SS2]|uniref:DUF6533 domain-containing protein n=1 Tax=Coniophora puteana (strain RWD-64-598) TaxID=741705 RepID=A0A5M3MBH9_CONPW|nr:uncharacterized protein CONPUDRAFT_158461 [Coniophora puteana RWD-64-598 SS2]EIW76433.1 hypothetical protein CONPUDRAFT_158461 [Coniophora puteana RWD-64-598 SS2]